MPNALDLLTTCVEAGLSLDFGLQRVAERYQGPLSDEIHRVLREMGLGKPRRDALDRYGGAHRACPTSRRSSTRSCRPKRSVRASAQVLRVQATADAHAPAPARRADRATGTRQDGVPAGVCSSCRRCSSSRIGPVILAVIRAFQDSACARCREFIGETCCHPRPRTHTRPCICVRGASRRRR